MWGVDVSEPISSSGFATNVSRSNGSGPRRRDRAHRVEPGEQARLHVGHAGAVGAAVGVDPERALGGGARVEDRVHVADEEDPRPAGRARAASPDDRRPEAPRRVGPGLDLARRCRTGTPATNRPTSSTPSGV